MDLKKLVDKKVALLGFGIENISVAKFLLKHKIDFTVLDKAPVEKLVSEGQSLIKDTRLASGEPRRKKLKIKTGEDYLANLSDYDIIIRSPGIPYLTPEIQNAKSKGSEITSSTKLFLDWCPAKVIGVTGTKGKGTTASLIFQIMKRKFEARNSKHETNSKSKILNSKNVSDFDIRISDFPQVYLVGNIGIASFDIIEKVKSDDLVVFELSSFQIQDLEKSPHVAVVVNLTDDHLDYHQTLEEYHATKQAVLKFQTEKDFAVLNKDYPECYKLKDFGKAKKYFFSSKDPMGSPSEKKVDGAYVNHRGEVILTIDGEEKVCNKDEIGLIGRHNLENIAAAAIVGKIFNLSTNDIHKAVIEFKGLEHRLEFVLEIDGVKFYNDSFSTNPTPTMAAIDSFSEPITIILGGSSKGADFTELAKKIKGSTVKNIILIGAEGPKIKESLERGKVKAEIFDGGENIDQIIRKAYDIAGGGVVLFSPACASFDMFKNYKDRGERFKEAVRKLR